MFVRGREELSIIGIIRLVYVLLVRAALAPIIIVPLPPIQNNILQIITLSIVCKNVPMFQVYLLGDTFPLSHALLFAMAILGVIIPQECLSALLLVRNIQLHFGPTTVLVIRLSCYV